MKRPSSKTDQHGFTLVELLVALGMFLLVIGAAFTLLAYSQQRYQTESQVLSSFQEARLGLDQMVRDINDAGFPPPSYLASPNPNPLNYLVSSPFAWSSGSGYPNTPCQIGTNGGGTCFTASGDTAPGDFDIIIETTPNPRDPACTPSCQVQWIRYQLGGPNGTTLMRGVANKTSGHDPDSDTSAQLVPFVQNVVNKVCPPQLPTCQAAYPGVFAGGPVPIFQYSCDHPPTIQSPPPPTTACISALADNSAANIRDINITLIVAAPSPDATTGIPRLVQLEGRGRRVNPNQ